MAGFTAENVQKGLVSFLGVQELESIQEDERKRDDCQILDVTEAAGTALYLLSPVLCTSLWENSGSGWKEHGFPEN